MDLDGTKQKVGGSLRLERFLSLFMWATEGFEGSPCSVLIRPTERNDLCVVLSFQKRKFWRHEVRRAHLFKKSPYSPNC